MLHCLNPNVRVTKRGFPRNIKPYFKSTPVACEEKFGPPPFVMPVVEAALVGARRAMAYEFQQDYSYRQVTPERPPLQMPKYGRFSCDHMPHSQSLTVGFCSEV